MTLISEKIMAKPVHRKGRQGRKEENFTAKIAENAEKS
jgi:hypothetical protein